MWNMGVKMEWSEKEIDFLIKYYPMKGKRYCAEKLNKSVHSIRAKTSRLKLYQDRSSDFFKDWQNRAGTSKIGKKRPDQAKVMLDLHAAGKFLKNEQQKKSISIRVKEWIKLNGHPKGMSGKTHSDEFKKNQSKRSLDRWNSMSEDEKIMRNKKIMVTRFKRGIYSTERKNCSWKSGWREIGLIKKYYRSRWEANYARYLEWLKMNGKIKSWEHESQVFWFDGIKRGCTSYLPDFKVTNNDDTTEFHEVKGWMDAASKTKINRMRIYHPTIKLIVIEKKLYNEIRIKLSPLIKGWE